MKTRIKIVTFLIVGLALAIAGTAAAQDGTTSGTCTLNPDGTVSGTVVSVDTTTTKTVTLLQGTTLCTMTMADDTTTHPVAKILGQLFGDFSAGELEAAQVCLVSTDGGITYHQDACSVVGALSVIAYDGTNFTVLNADGVTMGTVPATNVTDSANVVTALTNFLKTMSGTWTVDDLGKLVQTSDEIAAYHDAGIGFGVLVKLYSIQMNNPGVSEAMVSALVARFDAGEGWGKIFKDYKDKITYKGVGHARKEVKSMSASPTSTPEPTEEAAPSFSPGNSGKNNPGVGHGNGNGNGNNGNQGNGACKGGGNGKGKGQGKPSCP